MSLKRKLNRLLVGLWDWIIFGRGDKEIIDKIKAALKDKKMKKYFENKKQEDFYNKRKPKF